MIAVRVILAVLCLAVSCPAEWTQDQKGWALGTSAILTEMAGSRHDVLWNRTRNEEIARKRILSQTWGINSRGELLATIRSLMQEDSDHLHVAWNYERGVNLARWGYGVSYLTEAEAWNFIMPAAQRLQQTFPSWQDLGEAYLIARERWYTDDPEERRYAEGAFRKVALDPDGPWRKYPWNLDLGSGHAIPPSTEKTTWMEIAAHPHGLMCVRVAVPDHKHDDAYLAAIEDAVGCQPHITRETLKGPDWILDTECTRPGVTVGAQVIAQFHPEGIAEQLRKDGVTQVYTYFEHIPHNSSSIVPAASDSYITNGWRYYIDRRSLHRPLPDTVMTYGVEESGVRLFGIAAIFFVIGSLATAGLIRGRAKAISRFPLIFWAAWLLLTISLRGLAVASFWTAYEGLVANILAFTWYGTAVLLLRTATEMLMQRGTAPEASIGRTLAVCLWRACAETPFAISIAMLCDPELPLDPGVMIVMLAMGAMTVLIAWHRLLVATDRRGGITKGGELYDEVFELAKQMRVPLRRLYIQPENVWRNATPWVGATGELMIPERLLRGANRREVDGLVGYTLMLIRKDLVKSILLPVVPMVLILGWRAYMYQHSSSGNLSLFREAGVMLSAFVAFHKSLRSVYSKAETAFRSRGGDAEGLIAGLARAAKIEGVAVSPEILQRIAKTCAVPPERLPDLTEKGFPETGRYEIPDFNRTKLVLLS